MRRLIAAIARSIVACSVLAFIGAGPAHAIVGGAAAPADLKTQTVLIVSTRGASCTGVVLSARAVLTAAHCVQPAADYAVVLFEAAGPRLVPVTRIALHPNFDPKSFETRRPTPDLAVVRLNEALPPDFRPAQLSADLGLPARATRFVLVGYGVAKDGDGKSAGTLRSVELPSIGTTGGIMIRLSSGAAAGGCTGDSGGPVLLDGVVTAIIGWSTASGGARGCGGVTGATVIGPQRAWIDATARGMGAN